mmetsp:Transcript_48565/g.104650  ORF Transcript_48565/g.104650 Transcript_48565/m.104650 type:complete len:398 (+) Transcript_48565:171-1364(+)|eukprot:CAMPEP_0206435188 /NCGR_PEP_ID=MMETSP0324_2-20121206/9679_1 /ASSEMBLY_ACC=CAM_ASM_000836 /TAXON_ID=2866 /ORGANISM="Crypthecodinium cohnii, Strain Seligo" /LENGTH=397 /DNA_ID=CAMNT_0053901995 /DNA_START=70 /DNA_END=1263 /DNA_ORIENTATION=-
MYGLNWVNSTLAAIAAEPIVEGLLTQLANTKYIKALVVTVTGDAKIAPDVLLAWLLGTCVMNFLALMTIKKGRLCLWGLIYFLLSADKKCRNPTDSTPAYGAPGCKRMKVVFIRHGESEWNAVFNEGSKLTLPFRFLSALWSEAFMFLEQDSIFFDSPLSQVGVDQSWQLMRALAAYPQKALDVSMSSKPVQDLDVSDLVSIIRGDSGKSIVASSILRRAISTGFISLAPRFLRLSGKDRMQIMTSLQEISRNVDTLALAPAFEAPKIPIAEAKDAYMGDIMTHFYRNRFDPRLNKGNKSLRRRAISRQDDFVKWIFQQRDVDMVIVLGHSFWFREFFKSYLPKSSNHIAKKEKLVNCGCVAFDFYQDARSVTQIPVSSIKVIHGGFGKAKKKAKLA